MNTRRNVAPRPMAAQVISLAAYREAHRRPVAQTAAEPVRASGVSLIDAYCRWLVLAGALWTCWW